MGYISSSYSQNCEKNMDTLPQVIPKIVENMDTLPQVIPNIVNDVEAFTQGIPRIVLNMGTCRVLFIAF